MKYQYTFEIRASHPITDKALDPINEMLSPLIDQKITADFYLCESVITSEVELPLEKLREAEKIIKETMGKTVAEKSKFRLTTVKLTSTKKIL